MMMKELSARAEIAILTLAAIKAAAQSFDHGEANVFDTLDAIGVTVEAYRAAVQPRPRREAA
jgi:hypothetical protein